MTLTHSTYDASVVCADEEEIVARISATCCEFEC